MAGAALLYTAARFTDIRHTGVIEKYAAPARVNSLSSNNSQTLHCGDIETNYTLEKALKVQRQKVGGIRPQLRVERSDMSILWERAESGTLYQVRQAGRSMRLYTNGVLHSQYNPGRPLTGSVWDLLFLPAYFYPPASIHRVLVLGVGGGAVIQQLRRFVQPDTIIGVELNPVHLSVARRFFAVKGKGVQLIQADAKDWIKRYQGPPFDIIIDDLFGEVDGEPQRAVHAGQEWVRSLTGCLSREGMIISNFESRLELMVSAYLHKISASKTFDSAFHLSTLQNYNAVGVFLKKPATTRQLRDRLKRVPQFDPRYTIRTLHGAGRSHD